jgi:hypothetical protein
MKSVCKFSKEGLEGLSDSKVWAGSKTPQRLKMKALNYLKDLRSRYPRVLNNTFLEITCFAGVKTST